MKLGIMQPYIFPYIGYFQLLNMVDKYVIYDDVNYIKGGWINRNRILMNHQSSFLTFKLREASSFKKINEIELLSGDIEKRKLLNTIISAYGRAPYYKEVFPLIKSIIENPENNLAKYIEFSIREIAKYLDINTEIILSSNLSKDNSLRAYEKVIEICHKLEISEYVNAIGGQELYNYDDFKKANIKLQFLKTRDINYKQFGDEFVPNLSIIDVMMFNSKDEVKKMLNEYDLISGGE